MHPGTLGPGVAAQGIRSLIRPLFQLIITELPLCQELGIQCWINYCPCLQVSYNLGQGCFSWGQLCALPPLQGRFGHVRRHF